MNSRDIGISDNLNTDILRVLLPNIKRDFAAFENYNCNTNFCKTIKVPITCLCAEKDSYAEEQSLFGWSSHTSQWFELYVVEGAEHHYFGDSKSLEIVAENVINPLIENND